MKRLFIIIGILAIIFLGMVIYKNTTNKSSITVQEIENIESYISKIYMWKEITNEALPTFDDVNNADELWLWEVVKKNLEEYEISYEYVQNKAEELFGNNFQKQFPKEGTVGLEYNQESNKYLATEVDIDAQEDVFLLNNIEKKKDKYIVEIIEYIEDYLSEESIIIRNIQGEEIGKVSISDSEAVIQNIVKGNIDRFSKKKIYLKKEQEKIVVEKSEGMK